MAEHGNDERLTAKAFHAAEGVGDWRVLFWGAHAHWRCSSLVEGAKLVAAIVDVATELGHEPDVDLRPEGVTVRTCSGEFGALSEADVELARSVSRIASELGLEADPSGLSVLGIAVAQDQGADVRPFWTAVLGYDELDQTDAVDPHRRGPHLMFHEPDPPKPRRGRFHIDVSVPSDVAEARVEAALAAGGRMVDDSHAPMWWTLASPENHGVDIAAWPDTKG